MPVVFRHDGIRFYFLSNEGNPRELIHFHAGCGDADVKLWLNPDVRIADSSGYSRREESMEALHEHFG